jgi:predicted SnoaL-like aldol condensation-catalyzing enzyme
VVYQARIDGIRTLLKGIETGDPRSVAVVNEAKYIQHNPQTKEGHEGLASLFKRLSKTNPHVNIVRGFADGDKVFAHTEYDFSTRRIGFEVFRFEDERAVEHWDNIQPRKGPNPSGHSMVDGPVDAVDLDKTEANRALVKSFVDTVLIDRHPASLDKIEEFVDEHFTEHNPRLSDGVGVLRETLAAKFTNDTDEKYVVQYNHTHRILAEGNFVLCVNEGEFEGVHSSFYDLFRVANGKIVEHWDTLEHVPPKSEWKNNNGKF